MPTKAELVDELGKGKTKAEVAELEAMSKTELEELAGDEVETPAAKGPGETVPGGRFKVGEKIVDSEGKEIGKAAR